jgi:hypothetical protein
MVRVANGLPFSSAARSTKVAIAVFAPVTFHAPCPALVWTTVAGPCGEGGTTGGGETTTVPSAPNVPRARNGGASASATVRRQDPTNSCPAIGVASWAFVTGERFAANRPSSTKARIETTSVARRMAGPLC